MEIGWWSASHGLVSDNCQSDHQDYLAWKRSKSPLIVFLGITTTIILDLLLSYAFYILGVRLPGRTGRGLFLLMAFPAFLIWRPVMDRFGTRRFRDEWQARGGLPASAIPTSE